MTMSRNCMWCRGTKKEICLKCFGNVCPNCDKGFITCTWCNGTGREPSTSLPEEDALGFIVEEESNEVSTVVLRQRGIKGMRMGPYARHFGRSRKRKAKYE